MANQNNNNIDFTYKVFLVLQFMFLLLDHDKIHKKQKFSALDTDEWLGAACGRFIM